MTSHTALLSLILAVSACATITDPTDRSPNTITEDTDEDTDRPDTDNEDTDNEDTDNEDTDRDGDGLSNDEEALYGTDPDYPDTDNDGYTDFEEIDAGTDPLDSDDVIYTGGWPYNPNKEVLEKTASAGPAALGTQLPRFSLVDQYGEVVDLYDLAGHGKPIMLDLGSPYCRSCQNLAAFLSDGDTAHMTYSAGENEGETVSWWRDEFEALYDHVQRGDVIWITVLTWGTGSTVATVLDQSDAEGWAAAFPNPYIPVLADSDAALADYINRNGTPSLTPLDENLVFLARTTPQSTNVAISALLADIEPLN